MSLLIKTEEPEVPLTEMMMAALDSEVPMASIETEKPVTEVPVTPQKPKPRRAVRIANCSGAKCTAYLLTSSSQSTNMSSGDPGFHMLNQAKYGNVDVITGDYLAEFNLALDAEAMRNGTKIGYEQTALDGLTLSLDIINEKRIKVIINGGALNPKALAEKTVEMVGPYYGWKVSCVDVDRSKKEA